MNQRNGQQGRQGQRPQQRTENQEISDQQTAAGLFNEIIRGVERMQPAIEAVLPRDVSFATVRATLMMAMRHSPDIMTCSTMSIVTGCMKAAIDGVMLDGREAALVPSMNKVKDPVTNREFTRRDARYNIMVAGMRKQILKGGLVRDVQTTVVYANDKFSYERGLNPKLEHTPVLEQDKRGDKIGAYSVAWFHDGGMPSFEVMNRQQIEDVREMAQSGPVWKGKVADEMWRKTVLRRHRKSLPGGNDVSDMEARDDFPQFIGGDASVPQTQSGELPNRQQSAEAPRREQFAQLDHTDDASGTPLDFGTSGEMTAEEVERETRGADDKPAQQQRADPPKEQQAAAADPVDDKPRTIGPVPEGFETWEAWQSTVVTKMKTAPTLPRLDAVVDETRALFDQAPDEVRKVLGDLYEEKATDHREAVK